MGKYVVGVGWDRSFKKCFSILVGCVQFGRASHSEIQQKFCEDSFVHGTTEILKVLHIEK